MMQIDAEERAVDLLLSEADVSTFEGLIRRSLKPVGASSVKFFPVVVQYVMSTMVSNLMAETEVLDMVKLVNEAFQRLGTFNWGPRGV